MKYLAEKNILIAFRSIAIGLDIVHRDLALRNILISLLDKPVVKVGDLGMSRLMQSDYYKSSRRQIPIKWASPKVKEVHLLTEFQFLEFGKCTTQSDVFSFGVVLWEIFSYGRQPWMGVTNEEALKKVLKGERMEKPENCEEEAYHCSRGRNNLKDISGCCRVGQKIPSNDQPLTNCMSSWNNGVID